MQPVERPRAPEDPVQALNMLRAAAGLEPLAEGKDED
jgi:hypothetical protein